MTGKKTSDRYQPLQREYAANAGDYDRRWKRYVRASVNKTLEEVQLEPGSRLLDIGCGTGVLLEQLVLQQPKAQLYGGDLSNAMLSVARERLGPSAGLVQTAGESLPVAEASIDVLVSSSAFHFVRDPGKALNEMRRVLRPGGRLVLTDWCRDFLTMRMLDGYLKAFDAAHYHTYGSQQLAQLLDAHGFGEVRISHYRIDWFWGLFTATATRPTDQPPSGLASRVP